MQRHIEDLAEKRTKQKAEEDKIAREKAAATTLNRQQAPMREQQKKQHAQDFADEKRKIDQRLADIKRQQAKERIDVQRLSREQKANQAMEVEQEEKRYRDLIAKLVTTNEQRRQEEEKKRQAEMEFASKVRGVFNSFKTTRRGLQDDIEAFRKKTDDIVADMRDKLEKVKEAKAKGLPISSVKGYEILLKPPSLAGP